MQCPGVRICMCVCVSVRITFYFDLSQSHFNGPLRWWLQFPNQCVLWPSEHDIIPKSCGLFFFQNICFYLKIIESHVLGQLTCPFTPCCENVWEGIVLTCFNRLTITLSRWILIAVIDSLEKTGVFQPCSIDFPLVHDCWYHCSLALYLSFCGWAMLTIKQESIRRIFLVLCTFLLTRAKIYNNPIHIIKNKVDDRINRHSRDPIVTMT